MLLSFILILLLVTIQDIYYNIFDLHVDHLFSQLVEKC